MRKGVMFSIETMYLLAAVFVAVVITIHFLPTVNQPEYDFISTLKVAHDMGQNNTSRFPEVTLPVGSQSNYLFGPSCGNTSVQISFYEYNHSVSKEVCSK